MRKIFARLRVDKEDFGIFKEYLKLPKEQQSIIINRIKSIELESSSIDINNISDQTDFPPDKVRKFLKYAQRIYLTYYEYGKSKENFIKNVITKSIKEEYLEEFDLEIFEKTIKEILEIENIAILSKIRVLLGENPNPIINCKIFTDLRHIYYEDLAKKPNYAIIKHTLRVRYFEDNFVKDFYFTLDMELLNELKKTIERAIQKEQILNNICQEKEIFIFKKSDFDE